MAEERSQMATGPAIVIGILILAGMLFFLLFLGHGAEIANKSTKFPWP